MSQIIKKLSQIKIYDRLIRKEIDSMESGFRSLETLERISKTITKTHKYYQESNLKAQNLYRKAKFDNRGTYKNKFLKIQKECAEALGILDELYNLVIEKLKSWS